MPLDCTVSIPDPTHTSTLTPCAVSHDVAPPKYFIMRVLIHPSTYVNTYDPRGGVHKKGIGYTSAGAGERGNAGDTGDAGGDEFGLLCRNNIHTRLEVFCLPEYHGRPRLDE